MTASKLELSKIIFYILKYVLDSISEHSTSDLYFMIFQPLALKLSFFLFAWNVGIALYVCLLTYLNIDQNFEKKINFSFVFLQETLFPFAILNSLLSQESKTKKTLIRIYENLVFSFISGLDIIFAAVLWDFMAINYSLDFGILTIVRRVYH